MYIYICVCILVYKSFVKWLNSSPQRKTLTKKKRAKPCPYFFRTAFPRLRNCSFGGVKWSGCLTTAPEIHIIVVIPTELG